MPDTMSGYMTQRFRWVYGAMQLSRAIGAVFCATKKSPLTAAQRYYFYCRLVALVFRCPGFAIHYRQFDFNGII